MRLLNLCCGSVRVVDDVWVNLDNLHATLLPGTPERVNLDAEPNYVNYDVESGYGLYGLAPEMFDGILASHCFEHWNLHSAISIMRACYRLLAPGGVLLVSVPDATVFRKNWEFDTVENAERLYGEPIHLPDGETTFLGYAGFNRFHKTLLSEDVLWCYFVRAGFEAGHIRKYSGDVKDAVYQEQVWIMAKLLNRIPFSLIMGGTK